MQHQLDAEEKRFKRSLELRGELDDLFEFDVAGDAGDDVSFSQSDLDALKLLGASVVDDEEEDEDEGGDDGVADDVERQGGGRRRRRRRSNEVDTRPVLHRGNALSVGSTDSDDGNFELRLDGSSRATAVQ